MDDDKIQETPHSVNLHYLNLNPDPDGDSGSLQSIAYSNFRDIEIFLNQAERRIRQTKTLQVEWRAPVKLDHSNHRKAGSKEKSASGIWIQLIIPQGEDEDKYEPFFTEQYLSDKTKARKGDIEVLDVDRENDLLLVSRTPADRYLHIHPNTWTLFRQKKAVINLLQTPDIEHRPLIRLAYNERDAHWPAVSQQKKREWKILDDKSFTGVEYEKEFVSKALGTPDFAILEGPPGSGKTITICELILQEIELGHRVMLCASTHVAVDNVLERLVRDGWTKKKVVAVRIGREGDVTSDDVVPLILDRWVETETRDLLHKLSNVKPRTESQDYLLKALQEDGENLIMKMVLDTANLVCGTTIGILQHPDIKKGLTKPAFPQYDLLIVDEASKTTFQEFLVPALYARRWVLVGDVRQLSPYVEEDVLLGNLEGILNEDRAKAVLAPFLAWWHNNQRRAPGAYLYADSDPEVRKMIFQQAEALGLPAVEVTPGLEADSNLPLLTSSLFVVDPANLEEVSHLVPPEAENIMGTQNNPLLSRRKAFWNAHNSRHDQRPAKPDDSDNRWETAVAWRIVRQFELRRRPEEARKWDDAIRRLLPLWPSVELTPEGRERDLNEIARRDLNRVRRIALPSVLELLQVGFEGDNKRWNPCAITDGIPPDALAERHSVLKYQHRMHPDISRFPREHIYDQECLLDPADVVGRQEWRSELYNTRCIWIDVKGEMDAFRRNQAEAECIERELRRFIEWAQKNRKKHGQAWEAALLTFYNGQLSEIRHRVQRIFDDRNKWNFRSSDGTVHVTLGTVDRFQGHEADIVFLSFVRNRGLGFLDCPNRLNVGLTRARHQLVIVGNRQLFLNQERSELLHQLALETPYEFHFRTQNGKGESR